MKTSRELPPFSEENYHRAAAELQELIREAWPLFFYVYKRITSLCSHSMLSDKNVDARGQKRIPEQIEESKCSPLFFIHEWTMTKTLVLLDKNVYLDEILSDRTWRNRLWALVWNVLVHKHFCIRSTNEKILVHKHFCLRPPNRINR